MAVCLLACLLAAGCGPPTGVLQAPDRPNVILILTDDLDARLLQEHTASYPNIRKLASEGTTFSNAFVTDPLCCPSRATILRGQYAHNHQIVGNWWPRGGSKKFRVLGLGGSTLATWLQDESYRTVLIGKYMNDYFGTRVPVGWDDWYAIAGNFRSTDLNENGRIVSYEPKRHHLDDVLAQKALGYVRDTSADEQPFFMWLGTKAPHAPATPAPPPQEHLSRCPACAPSLLQRARRLRQARVGARQSASKAKTNRTHGRPLPRPLEVDAGRRRYDRAARGGA